MRVREWAHELVAKRRSGSAHAFIVSGNVTDYVARDGSDYFTVLTALERLLGKGLRIGPYAFVFVYDVGDGIRFLTPEMKDLFEAMRRAKIQKMREEAAAKKLEARRPPPPKRRHRHGLPMPPGAPEEQIEDGDPFGSRNLGDANLGDVLDAQIMMELPVPLRQVYLELSAEKKAIARQMTLDDRLRFLRQEQRLWEKGGDLKGGDAEESGEIPPFHLPEKPAEIWEFSREILEMDLEEIRPFLPPEDFRGAVAVIIRNPELAISSAPHRLSGDEQFIIGMLRGLAGSSEMAKRGNLLFLITEDDARLPDTITSPNTGFHILEVPHPDEDQREAFLTALPGRVKYAVREQSLGDRELQFPSGIPIKDLARGASAGLRIIDLETLGIDALVPPGGLTGEELAQWKPELAIESLWARKRVYLERLSGKQVMVKRPVQRFDWIGGHDAIKAYFGRVAEALRHGDVNRSPKGLLLVGPPGTGKSVLCQALAELAGFSYAEIDLEFDPFVGQSARNRARNRRLLMSLAPVIAFEDEFEGKHLPRGAAFHGDSGVSARMDAMEREFLADDARRGKVLWIAATNRPDQLEAAMIRPGRFDRIVPVLPPRGAEARARVFEGVIRKIVSTGSSGVKFEVSREELLQLSENLPADTTQAHINEFCYRALQLSASDCITAKELARGISDVRPRKEPEILRQIQLAMEFANSWELVPEEYKAPDAVSVVEPPQPQAVVVSKVYAPGQVPPGVDTDPPKDGGEGGGKTN